MLIIKTVKEHVQHKILANYWYCMTLKLDILYIIKFIKINNRYKVYDTRWWCMRNIFIN